MFIVVAMKFYKTSHETKIVLEHRGNYLLFWNWQKHWILGDYWHNDL